jgi:hypothetical protein
MRLPFCQPRGEADPAALLLRQTVNFILEWQSPHGEKVSSALISCPLCLVRFALCMRGDFQGALQGGDNGFDAVIPFT